MRVGGLDMRYGWRIGAAASVVAGISLGAAGGAGRGGGAASPAGGTGFAVITLEKDEILPPEIVTGLGKMLGVGELPVRRELPDVLTMNDGTKVRTAAQWEKRREEMRKIL